MQEEKTNIITEFYAFSLPGIDNEAIVSYNIDNQVYARSITIRRIKMDFKFTMKLDGKTYKLSVHYLNSVSLALTLKDAFYRHYKTSDFNIPYLSSEQTEEFKNTGRLELIGASVESEPLDMIELKFK